LIHHGRLVDDRKAFEFDLVDVLIEPAVERRPSPGVVDDLDQALLLVCSQLA
jgi:hypothetical protein